MKNITKFGIVALLLVSLVGSAFAFSGNAAARDAIEAGDYGAWKEAKSAELTQERFNQRVERHQERAQHREEMNEAIEQGYDAWKQVVSDSPRGDRIAELITEENWDTFVAMHNARQNEDHDTAIELAEELGLPGKGPRGHKGMGKCGFGK